MSHAHTPIALTGIHTDIGKTVCAAVLARALQCDYWKPIQAGSLDHTDSDTVRQLSDTTHIHPETYRLQLAASPHTAARAEQVTIALTDLNAPATQQPLLIETAGGVCSPINDQHVVADLSRFADDDAHAVIDEEPASNNSPGVNLDAGHETGDLRDQPGQRTRGRTPRPQPVRDTVSPDSVDARIEQGDLQLVDRSRVFAQRSIEIFVSALPHSTHRWGGHAGSFRAVNAWGKPTRPQEKRQVHLRGASRPAPDVATPTR